MLLQTLLSCTQVPGGRLYSKAAFLCSDSSFRTLSLEADVISFLIDTHHRSLLRVRSRGDAGSSGAGPPGYRSPVICYCNSCLPMSWVRVVSCARTVVCDHSGDPW